MLTDFEDKCHEYVIVFERNINTTDVTRGELLSLLKRIIIPSPLLYILDSLDCKFPALCSSLKNRTIPQIAVFFLNQSALIRSNRKLTNDELSTIVGSSGYIHSIGESVLISKWHKLDGESIIQQIKDYCNTSEKKPCNIKFYTKEEASKSLPEDQKSRIESELHYLSPLAIDEKRWFLGRKFFEEAKRHIISKSKLEKSKKDIGDIIVIKDALISKDMKRIKLNILDYPGRFEDIYFIAYHSLYKNECLFHSYDEEKPYWAGIYTTPHNLVRTMLSLGEVGPGMNVLDPFCHTGTVAIESASIGANSYNYDIKESSGAKDNFYLANLDIEKLEDLNEKIKLVIDKDNYEKEESIYLKIADIAKEGVTRKEYYSEPKEGYDIESLRTMSEYITILKDFENRVIFYWMRRFFLLRFRGTDRLYKFVCDKHKKLEKYINCTRDLIKCELRNNTAVQENINSVDSAEILSNLPNSCPKKISVLNKSATNFEDNEFKALRVATCTSFNKDVKAIFETKDIKDLEFDPDTFDAIVTDPPYGYGEDITKTELEEIYYNFFRIASQSLKDGRNLIFCSLDKIKTGREKDTALVTHEVLEILRQVFCEFEINAVRKMYISPLGDQNIFYWKSKYALNRSIIKVSVIRK